MNSFISVILPIRNEQKYIAKCLRSIISQDYINERYEVLVVDGMSTDSTRTIVKQFQKRYKNIKLLDNPAKITPVGLNIGICHAKGNIIIRVDGHATLGENYLSQCVRFLESSSADCVGGPIESMSDTTVGKAIALAMSSFFGVGNARFRTSGKEGYVDTLAFGAYRKEVFKKIGLFGENLVGCEDDEFNYRLRKNGGRIFLTPEIKSYYYPREKLKDLWVQYFRYGLAKVRVVQKYLRIMQLRQFVPPVFVLALLGTGIFAFFSRFAFYVFGLIALSYLVVSVLVSGKISMAKGIRYFPLLPIVFAILHISYGLGFVIGLIRLLTSLKH